MTIGLTILGASGKMGKKVLQWAQKDPEFHLVGLGGREGSLDLLSSLIKNRREEILIASDPRVSLLNCDVAIDFSSHQATQNHLEIAASQKKAFVLGTTGHSLETQKAIENAAQQIPILFSPNFSFGIALCLDVVSRLGKALPGTCTIDILETHHKDKKDQPSGTALALAQAIGKGTPVRESQSGTPRQQKDIVIHSIRSGQVIGEHTIILEWEHERIELKHVAHSRDAFAFGALMAAKFLIQQPPGLYSLKDLFSH